MGRGTLYMCFDLSRLKHKWTYQMSHNILSLLNINGLSRSHVTAIISDSNLHTNQNLCVHLSWLGGTCIKYSQQVGGSKPATAAPENEPEPEAEPTKSTTPAPEGEAEAEPNRSTTLAPESEPENEPTDSTTPAPEPEQDGMYRILLKKTST